MHSTMLPSPSIVAFCLHFSQALITKPYRSNSGLPRLELCKQEENSIDDTASIDSRSTYSDAWRVRTQLGHDAAVHIYKQLLSNPAARDSSAATRVAASETSLKLLDQVGRRCLSSPLEWERDIAKLQTVLEKSNYNHPAIRETIFNLPIGPSKHQEATASYFEKHKNNYPFGPIYARPLQPGQYLDVQSLLTNNLTPSEDAWKSSLKCLVILFVLSGCIPKLQFLAAVYGGKETLDLLKRLGLIFIFDDVVNDEEELVVPLVHLFPLEIPELIQATDSTGERNVFPDKPNQSESDGIGRSLIFMTDLHPNVLGLTSIPNKDGGEDGTVMYIGPDSLALVHHLHATFRQYWNSTLTSSDILINDQDSDSSRPDSTFRLVDFCTGSGVQALATLSFLQMLRSRECEEVNETISNALAIAVDINQRALRFTTFNTLLNGFDIVDMKTERDIIFEDNDERMKICTLHADLVSGKVLDQIARDAFSVGHSQDSIQRELLHIANWCSQMHNSDEKEAKFDVILANPPFIPTPSKASDKNVLTVYGNKQLHEDASSIPLYGMFSSGGEDGEECLLSIIQMAPGLLKTNGLAAIVSEFMNPPTAQTGLDPSMHERNLCSKIETCWSSSNLSNFPLRGILFTNQQAISSNTYAERRAIPNDSDDLKLWKDHLDKKKIHSVSPGLLFLRSVNDPGATQEDSSLILEHRIVPKTKLGSIWTPHNFAAVEFVSKSINGLVAK